MELKRRAFLQQLGFSLAALGISETGLWQLSDRYQQVLAQPTLRKLALLVGINQYPRGAALNGCVTDVELQRELLIHRFAFQASDILTLTDQQATRQNIETAFVHHLIHQARAGDVVVFHFSGYGSSVNFKADSDSTQISLVPVDSIVTADALEVNDLSEETLLLLLRSLQTDRVTTILDTSYTLPKHQERSLQGNLRIRARLAPPTGQLSPLEVAFQEQLLSQINSSKNQARVERRSGQTPGILLAAAGDSDLAHVAVPTGKAFETRWSGFSAGLFTYALTQYLWHATPETTLQVSFNQAASTVGQVAGREQRPTFSGQKSREQALLTYHLTPEPSVGVDGVITAVEEDGKVGHLWLAGLPASVLEHYGLNSLLSTLPEAAVSVPASAPETASQLSNSLTQSAAGNTTQVAEGPAQGQPVSLQIYARSGLMAKARICCGSSSDRAKLQSGQYVQEVVRVLPRQVGLTVAIDSNLTRIERVDATSAFAGVLQVKAVTAGEQPADCVFGKLPEVATALVTLPSASAKSEPSTVAETQPGSNPNLINPGPTLETSKPLPQSRYALFSAGQDLIANTLGPGGEAVKSAVQRVTPQFQTLLAAKLLRLTANEGSSRLGVKATLEMVAPQEQILAQRETLRAPWISAVVPVAEVAPTTEPLQPQRTTGVLTLPVGGRIRYRVQNYSDRPIYLVLLGFDTSGSAITLYSGQSLRSSEETDNKPTLKQEVIAPGETLTVPHPSTTFEWVVREPTGMTETHLVLSCAPFTQTLAALEAGVHPVGTKQRLGIPPNPLEVAQAVLQDLHAASMHDSAIPNMATDGFALNVDSWATLSFIYQVI